MVITALNFGSALYLSQKRGVGKRKVVVATTTGYACARAMLTLAPPPVAFWGLRVAAVGVPSLMVLRVAAPFLKAQFENSVAPEMFNGSTTTPREQYELFKRVVKWGLEDKYLWGSGYALLVVNSLSSALLPVAFTKLLHAATTGSPVGTPLAHLLGAAFLVASVDAVQSVVFNEAMTWMQVRIQRILLGNVMRQDTAFFDATPAAEILAELSSSGVVTGVLSGLIPTLIRSIVTAGTTMVVLCRYDPRLAAVCVVAVPFNVVSSLLYSRYFEKYNEKAQSLNVKSNTIVLDTIISIRTIRLFAAEREQLGRFWTSVGELIKLRRANNWILACSGVVDVLLPHIINCLVFFSASQLARSGSISVASMITVTMYQSSLTEAFESFMAVYVEWGGILGDSKKVFEMMDRLPKEMQRSNYIPDKLQGAISFRNVTFAYSTNPVPVLTSFNLTIRPGEIVALVGPSGGGKSTIVNLILGLYDPSEGTVSIDGIPLHNYDPHYLYSSAVSVVSQDPAVFSASFAKNIALGMDLTAEQIEAAAKRAHAHEFIAKTKDGYDTLIGRGGESLSGGQRQRVAIARALARNPAILLLDEATSALDGESEAIVQEAVQEVMAGRTVVVVAHRLSTVQRADRILVVADGRIVEEGTHKELLQLEGVYKRMVLRQLRVEATSDAMDGRLSPTDLESLAV